MASAQMLAAILISIGAIILLIRPLVSLVSLLSGRQRRATAPRGDGQAPLPPAPPRGGGYGSAPSAPGFGGYADAPAAQPYAPSPAAAPVATMPAPKAAPSGRGLPPWLTLDRAIAFGSLVVGVVALFKK